MYYEKCVMRGYYRVRQRSGKTPGLFLFPLRLEILYIPYSGDVGSCYDFKVQKNPRVVISIKQFKMERRKSLMFETFVFVLGVVVGCITAKVIFRVTSGHGYFKLDIVSEEDGLYSVNMRLIPDQKLNKKKRIILKQEH